MASVKVAVRARPLNKREIENGAKIILKIDDNKAILRNIKVQNEAMSEATKQDPNLIREFAFDNAYWSVDQNHPCFVGQEKIYRDVGMDVVQSAMSGYNACIFAYGQTGAGKTYTMTGTDKNPGLIPRICEDLFGKLNKSKDTISFRIEVSYMEIYNEQVRDLLKRRPVKLPSKVDAHTNLKVREHPKDGPFVQGLTVHPVSDYASLESLMDEGNATRITASTMMNESSSRSHAIFTVKFTQASFAEQMPSETVSKINLVDLAGSERAGQSGASGIRLKEGGNINKSLVTLGLVISALADNSNHDSDAKHAHKRHAFVPYRDSVLTYLLKDSFGGNSRTIMIAAISPADAHYSETLSTLRYASRARRIINKPVVNEDPNVKLIRELRLEIERLQTQINENKELVLQNDEKKEKITKKLMESEMKADELTKSWIGKWTEAQQIFEEKALSLSRCGSQILLTSENPHFVGIDVDPLSADIVIYHLQQGRTVIGCDDFTEDQAIALHGSGIEKEHCYVDVTPRSVTLYPVSPLCMVNGHDLVGNKRLRQGDVVQFGHSFRLRFNNPREAEVLKEKRRSGRFSPIFQRDQSLDSGLSSPEDLERQLSYLDTNISMESLETAAILEDCPEQVDSEEEMTEEIEHRRSDLHRQIQLLRESEITRFEDEKVRVEAFERKQKELNHKRKQLEEFKFEKMGKLNDAKNTLKLFREKWKEGKEKIRRRAEREIDQLIELKLKQLKRSGEYDREFRKKRHLIRTKSEDYWKRMDLYDNLLVEVELERKGVAFDNDALKSRTNSLLTLSPKTEVQEMVEKKKVLEQLISNHMNILTVERRKLDQIEEDMASKKEEHEQGIKQTRKLLSELSCHRHTFDVGDIFLGTSEEDVHGGSASTISASSDRINSDDSDEPLPSRRRSNSDLDKRASNDPIQRFGGQNFSSKKLSMSALDEKPSKRWTKYNQLVRDLKQSLQERERARDIELEKLEKDLKVENDVVRRVSIKIQDEEEELQKLEADLGAKTLERIQLVNQLAETETSELSLRSLQLQTEKEKLLESRTKVRDMFETFLQGAFDDLNNVVDKTRNRWSFSGSSKRELGSESTMAGIVNCATSEDFVSGLVEREWNTREYEATVEKTDKVINELTKKQVELHEEALKDLEERKCAHMSEQAERQKRISMSMEQLFDTVGQNNDHLSQFFNVEAQRMIDFQRKMGELEFSIHSKLKNCKELQLKIDALRSRRSNDEEGLDTSLGTIEEQIEAILSDQNRFESEAFLLKQKLEEEKREYLEMLRSQEEYEIIGQEYREACHLGFRVAGGDAISEIQKEIFWGSNAVEFLQQGLDPSSSIICGGWNFCTEEKQVTILKKKTEDSSVLRPHVIKGCGTEKKFNAYHQDFVALKQENLFRSRFGFLGCGIIKAAPSVVFETVRNPLSRYVYDSLLQRMKVVEHIDNHLKVVYMHHEARVCIMKHSRDFCCVHAEKVEDHMYISASQSVEHPDCPEQAGVIRAKVLPSGWAIEPIDLDGNTCSVVWYLVKVNLGKGLPGHLVSLLSKRLPLSIAYLRSYLVLS